MERGEAWLNAGEVLRLTAVVRQLRFVDRSPPNQKRPLFLRMLQRLFARWDLSMRAPLELATILLLGHNGLLRSGELMSGLRVSDITWDSPRVGFSLLLIRSKCGRSGPGVLVRYSEFPGLCAVRLMRRWFRKEGLHLSPNQLLFPTRTASWLRHQIKLLCSQLGVDPQHYSGHSLRAGGASDLFMARTPYFIIKKMGRWSSDAALLYMRAEDDVTRAVRHAFAKLSYP